VAELSLYGGVTWLDFDDEDNSTEGVVGGEAKIGFNASDTIGAQLDVVGEFTTGYDDSSFDDEGRQNLSGALHLFHRTPGYAVGVFGGADYFGVVDEEPHSRAHVGVEGQLFLGNTTLYGQAGASFMAEAEGDDHGEPVTGPFVRGVVRQFLTPYDKVEAELAYFYADDVKTGDQGPVNEVDWGVSYEHQYMNVPASVFVEYDGYYYEDNSHSSSPVLEHMVFAGVKVLFNQKDLLTLDRQGTSFDTHMWRGINWLEAAH